MSDTYLPHGMPIPVPQSDGLDAVYWEGLRNGVVNVQRCAKCQTWQWGPEWICHHCNSFDMGWQEVAGEGVIYSWERPWHPVHPALKGHGPYIVVLVELPAAGNIRMIGNLLGDPMRDVKIGVPVTACFERHDGGDTPYTLLQWKIRDD
jgi:uncharacterized OB-fold protein